MSSPLLRYGRAQKAVCKLTRYVKMMLLDRRTSKYVLRLMNGAMFCARFPHLKGERCLKVDLRSIKSHVAKHTPWTEAHIQATHPELSLSSPDSSCRSRPQQSSHSHSCRHSRNPCSQSISAPSRLSHSTPQPHHQLSSTASDAN